jgi:hypothetical protein
MCGKLNNFFHFLLHKREKKRALNSGNVADPATLVSLTPEIALFGAESSYFALTAAMLRIRQHWSPRTPGIAICDAERSTTFLP